MKSKQQQGEVKAKHSYPGNVGEFVDICHVVTRKMPISKEGSRLADPKKSEY
jgi:hypothetical protein